MNRTSPQLVPIIHYKFTPLHRLKTPEFFKTRYGVDRVHYTDEIVTILNQLRPSALLIMNGVNSDSKSHFEAPSFEGMDQ
jgi:hypothetical protein